MIYNILCAGCSFTHGNKKYHLNNKPADWYPYANFLPGRTYNIGKCGHGISPKYFRLFFKQYKEEKLTHVVYQVPSPIRQPVDLNDYDEDHFRLRVGGSDKYDAVNGYTYIHQDGQLEEARINDAVWHPGNKPTVYSQLREFNIQVFDKKDQYLEKAIDIVNINVKLIRENQPNAKIIFLRYEDTRRPLLYEFTKGFYKTMLADYCKENDISYIYEENFNTKWFFNNKYGIHPNKVGAKLIADKIKEYL